MHETVNLMRYLHGHGQLTTTVLFTGFELTGVGGFNPPPVPLFIPLWPPNPQPLSSCCVVDPPSSFFTIRTLAIDMCVSYISVIVRGCEVTGLSRKCLDLNIQGVAVTECYCYTDFCNEAVSSSPNLTLLLLLPAIGTSRLVSTSLLRNIIQLLAVSQLLNTFVSAHVIFMCTNCGMKIQKISK